MTTSVLITNFVLVVCLSLWAEINRTGKGKERASQIHNRNLQIFEMSAFKGEIVISCVFFVRERSDQRGSRA